jgi:hypothetical protein
LHFEWRLRPDAAAPIINRSRPKCVPFLEKWTLHRPS